MFSQNGELGCVKLLSLYFNASLKILAFIPIKKSYTLYCPKGTQLKLMVKLR